MERSAYAFATGLFVIALGLGLLAGARWLQGPDMERRPYQVVAKSSVAGLSPYSKVYYRGVEVGQVTAIHFARDGTRDILLDIALESRVPVTVNTYAVLKSQGLTGLAFIELLDDGPLDAPELPTSSTDPGRIEMRPSLLESFQTVGQGIAEQIHQLAGNLNRLLAPESVARVGRILANLEDISARVDELLGLSRPAFTRLAPLLDQSDVTLAEAGTTLQALRDTLELLQARLRDAEAIAARADAAVAGVGQQVNSGILPELEAALAAIRAAADRFERLATTLENNPPALLSRRLRDRLAPAVPGAPGRWLGIELVSFEQRFVDDGAEARVAAHVLVRERRGGDLLASRDFALRVPAASADVDGGVAALAAALDRLAAAVIDWLAVAAAEPQA